MCLSLTIAASMVSRLLWVTSICTLRWLLAHEQTQTRHTGRYGWEVNV